MHTATRPAGASPRTFRPLSWILHLLTVIICIGAVIVLLWLLWGRHCPMDLRARGQDF